MEIREHSRQTDGPGDNMYLKYYEAGYVPIPIRPNSKLPAVPGFDKWAHDGIPRKLVEEFEEKFPLSKGYGIGILLGSASNLCVVDIDTDDFKVMQTCPPSPFRRRGKKGEARFFKYNPDLQNRAFQGKDENGVKIGGVDILVERKYIIIPPSIHPETGKPYIWLTEDDLLFGDREDLLILTAEDVDRIGALYGQDIESGETGVDLEGNFISPDGIRCAHGSYHRIKRLACGLIAECEPLESAVEKLLSYDQRHHTPIGYFDDRRSHSDFGADRYSNATRLYGNLLKAVNQNRINKGLSAQVPAMRERLEINIEALRPQLEPDKTFLKYPEPRGVMNEFVKYCELMGKGRQDALGLGGALTLMAGVCSNRYCSVVRGLRVTPNLYVLNLGYSSFGKDVSQRLLDDLLKDTGMVGSANYRSGSAMVHDLPKQQERVDLIDECSWLLKAMSDEKNSYQSEMVEILSLMFSRAGSRFNGIASVEHGGRKGAVWNPHISMLASTTPTGFKESVNSAMASKGLMPRFLTFFQKEIGDYKGATDIAYAEKVLKDLRESVNSILGVKKRIGLIPPVNFLANNKTKDFRDIDMGFKYEPIEIPFAPKAHAQWIEYERANHYKSAKNPDEFESPFFGRFAELVAKVGLFDSISLGRKTIEQDSLEWAIALVEICWKNIRPMYALATAENKLEKDQLRIMEIVEQNNGVIPKTDLIYKTRWLKRQDRDEHLASLVETSRIKEMSVKDPKNLKQKKPALHYATPRAYAAMSNKLHLATQ